MRTTGAGYCVLTCVMLRGMRIECVEFKKVAAVAGQLVAELPGGALKRRGTAA